MQKFILFIYLMKNLFIFCQIYKSYTDFFSLDKVDYIWSHADARVLMEFLFVVYRYNKITMYKDDPKFRRFANLEGHLEKLSTNFLLGYQPR